MRRLIDANDLWSDIMMLPHNGDMISSEEVEQAIKDAPTVDAVEVSRLGKLGQLMMPYNGCPRGMIGERGEDGTGYHLTELDAITDVDGNRWVPVLENDLSRFKAKVDAVEVVHGRWKTHNQVGSVFYCSECKLNVSGFERRWLNYCPNCGADMRGEGNG